MELLANSKNPYRNPIQRPYNGDFDPEKAYRKPPVIQNIVPKAGCNVHTGKSDQ
jgi:hypothetical protein